MRKEIVEDTSTRAQADEDGTGHPVKCGPPARKTGTRRAAAVEERAGQGIASTECSHAGRVVATAKSYSRVHGHAPELRRARHTDRVTARNAHLL